MTGVSGGGGLGGSVTSVSIVTANGISGSVATPATTPAITLSLGNITPTTVNNLTLSALATGFSIAGGTISKTLTVDETASLTGYAKKTDNLSVFAATTSLQLKGVISDETGSGALVFADTPTLVTPALGAATATSLNISYGNLTLTPVSAPGACTAASGAAGNVDIGDHIWKVTFVTAIGETELGSSSNTVTIAASAKQVNLTAIPTGPAGQGVTSRKIYRSKVADTTVFYLLTTIADNTATTYTDNTADIGLGADDATYRPNDTVWLYWAGNKSAIITLFNTYVGTNSGISNTTGSENSFFGTKSGYNNTTGLYNTFVGYEAGYNNAVGSYNTFIGGLTGLNNTQGNDNTFIGVTCGYNNTQGNDNTFIGYACGFKNNLGNFNTFIGFEAGYNNTSGSQNVFLGQTAGFSNITTSYNTFVGYDAGEANIADGNVFIGYKAGLHNTIGIENTFVGYLSGEQNLTTSDNTFIGFEAGRNNIASNNTFVGYEAGLHNTTGAQNVFIGFEAGITNITNNRCTFVGYEAGLLSIASDNTFIGNDSGGNNTTGGNNTFVGSNSGYINTSGSQNTAIGRNSGGANTTGSTNTYVGGNAGYTGTTNNLTNTTCLGYDTQVTASNSCILGNGQFVGIGLTNPTTMLDIVAADDSTAVIVEINATTANVTAADTFISFNSNQGSIGSIAGTAVSGVIAYNTFTGSHYSLVEDRKDLEIGMLLEIIDDGVPILFSEINGINKVNYTEIFETKEIIEEIDDKGNKTTKEVVISSEQVPKQRINNVRYKPTSPGHLFKTRICSTKKSKAAVGCYGGTDKEGRDLVLSIGTGFINVTNKGYNIEVGDYLISSDIKGCAELQDDDIYRSSTVAKSTDNVKWNDGETMRRISCIYLGG